MMNYILAEVYKFRKSNVKFALLLLLIPSLITFCMYTFNDKYGAVTWESYINLICTFLNDIVGPIVFGIVAAYILGHEYETKTMNVMFTYPVNRIKLLFCKIIAIFSIIFVSLMVVLFLSIISGLVPEHEELQMDIVGYYVLSYIKMSIYHFMLASTACAVAICVKSVLPAAIFVISATFINIVVVNSQVAVLYPWSAPVLLSPHENVGRTFVPSKALLIVLLVTFLISLAVSIKKYKYIE